MAILTVQTTYIFIITLFTFSVLLKFLEYLRIIKSFGAKGEFAFEIVGADSFLGNGWKIYRLIYSKKGMQIMFTTAILLYMAMWLALGNELLFRILLSFFILLNLIVHYRHNLGLDGADQMNLIISVSILLCYCLVDNEVIKIIGIIFIGTQLCLSYFIAGIAKLASKTWRSGLAVKGILSTFMFGSSGLRNLVVKNNWLNKLLCWGTIIFEIIFISCLFIPSSEVLICFLIVGALFHIANAIIMGLNDFVWSFLSAYPAIYYSHKFITSAIY